MKRKITQKRRGVFVMVNEMEMDRIKGRKEAINLD
jgi:hypothetical protein